MNRITKCRSCQADIIFLITEKGFRIPVNPNIDNMDKMVHDNDSIFDTRRHQSHFATCPAAKVHRKSNLKKEKVVC